MRRTNLKLKPTPSQNHDQQTAFEERISRLKNFKVYSTSFIQRLNYKLAIINRACIPIMSIGLFGGALSYFFLISIESSLDKHFERVDKLIKLRQDLESTLSKLNSWENLNESATEYNFQEAKTVKSTNKPRFLSHLLMLNQN